MTKSYNSVEIDLNSYFTDAKTPALIYEAVFSPKGIVSLSTSATAAGGGNDLVADGKLTVTAAGVVPATATSATAMITVSAYDGVNDPLTKTFDRGGSQEQQPADSWRYYPNRRSGRCGPRELYLTSR